MDHCTKCYYHNDARSNKHKLFLSWTTALSVTITMMHGPINIRFDENRWFNFGAVTYGRTNTQYEGFQKISSKNRRKKILFIKDDSAQRCDRNRTHLMTCKTHSYRKAASSSEILVPTCQTARSIT